MFVEVQDDDDVEEEEEKEKEKEKNHIEVLKAAMSKLTLNALVNSYH